MRQADARGCGARRQRRRSWILQVLLLLCGLHCLQGASAAALGDTAGTDGAAPRIGVLTMGPGEVFWERFGHDAIIVQQPGAEPVSYNFGYFDLDEPGFVGRFIQGRMRYMLVALPLADDLAYYRDAGRGAAVQWLDLTPAAARQLAADLARNARPENAHYRYDYFTDNCATRVRDALDRALGGQLRRQMEGRSGGDTYRSEALRLARPAPWMWLAFDIGLGPHADRPLSRWQLGFLPRRLADDLGLVSQPDGRPLVASLEPLLPQRLGAEPESGAVPLWPWLLAGVTLALLVRASAARRPGLLAAAAGVTWLGMGLVGLVLALGWAFTAHEAMWANRNLLLLSPLCLGLLPGAWRAARGRSAGGIFAVVLTAVAILAALSVLPLWLQVQPQRNGHWIALLLPLHLALALWFPRWPRTAPPPRD